MHTNQSAKKDRYLHLDITKFILIFSFMLAHFFPHKLGISLYWNTGGFVLMSGYITGILLPKKPLSFRYGTIKFLKINLWLLIYFSIIYLMYFLVGSTDKVYGLTTSYMSVLEYIGLFYLLVPLLGLTKRKKMMSLVVFSTLIILNYVILNNFKSQGSTVTHLMNLLFLGSKFPNPYYPLMSFVNIGVLGFLFGMVETSIPARKIIMLFTIILCLIISYLNERAVISVWTDRHPPLIFYIFFSLAAFSLLLDGSQILSQFMNSSLIAKIITSNAKYSIVIFVIHKPIFVILRKLNINALILGKFPPDLIVSITIVLLLSIALSYVLDNTIGRLPENVIKIIL